jgi:hypothetical protein
MGGGRAAPRLSWQWTQKDGCAQCTGAHARTKPTSLHIITNNMNDFNIWYQLTTIACYPFALAYEIELLDYKPFPISLFSVVERLHCKRPIPICRLFFKIDLLTYIAALCLTDFIDWRYIHSLAGIFDPACELLPPWTKELNLCTVAPLSSLWLPPPLPKLNVLFIQTVSVWRGEGGGWIVLCRSYSTGILHSVSDQMQNLPNYFTTPNKMTSENDIKGLESLKFLRPCFLYTPYCDCKSILEKYLSKKVQKRISLNS